MYRLPSKPTYNDAEYIKFQLGPILKKCLADVVEKRPLDPIEYIAQWLYKHSENEEYKRKVSKTTCLDPVNSQPSGIFSLWFRSSPSVWLTVCTLYTYSKLST